MNIKGKRITVVGLARTGVAVANLLTELGCKVTVSDVKDPFQLKENISKLKGDVALDLNHHTEKFFLEADLIVVSPGVRMDIPPLVKAREKGLRIISEIELVFLLSPVPFIAITGTNGKSTTTSLIGEMLKRCKKKFILGGNIGYPLAEEMLESKDKDFIVAEISTFQLEGISEFKPFIGIILNISPDHLDRHRDYREYIALKKRLYMNQEESDYLILNYDDPLLMGLKSEVPSKVVFFSKKIMPERGIYIDRKEIYWNDSNKKRKIGQLGDLGELGRRNIENVLASLATGLILNLNREEMLRSIRVFPGLPHRLEFVRDIDGVKFINDSKGTNVGAVIKSLNSFSEPIILIAGGKDKGSDYRPLKRYIKGKVKSVIIFGEAKDKIKEVLNGECEVNLVENLQDAVKKSFKMAVSGDVVLLSPACASFDMFRDFEDRGNQFKEIVRRIRGRKSRIF